jgi:cytochrome b561
MVLVVVHVLAALKHALVNRDGIWTRMVRGAGAAASTEPAPAA